jgi:hypothetical protein
LGGGVSTVDKTESVRDFRGLSFSVRVVLRFERKPISICHPRKGGDLVRAIWVPAFAGITGGRLSEGRKCDCPVDSRPIRLPEGASRKARGSQPACAVGNRADADL